MEIILGFRESIGYYFQKFEFNASIYYIVREWGFWMYGYNIIQTVGWKLALLSTLAILGYGLWDYIKYSRFKFLNNKPSIAYCLLPTACLFVISIYFAFSTTVHPWYITTLVAFSAMSTYRFAILWSGLIFLTYAGYTDDGFKENLWLTAIEYVLVIGYLAYELFDRKRVNENVS
jgi:hypothetical protein